MNFITFKTAVAAQFERLSKHQMFRVNVSKDDLWSTYLASFPEGTNPLFRERTEHDCTCCKQFIRAVGDCVAVIDGQLESIWDVLLPSEPGYQAVATALSGLVHSASIQEHFLHYEKHAGTDRNFEDVVGGTPRQWNHFFVNIPAKFVAEKSAIPSKLGVSRTSQETFKRALEEITDDAIDTVLDLIAQNSLYRGEEHKFAVSTFKSLKGSFNALKFPRDKEVFAWLAPGTVAGSVTGIRGSVIGTLLTDLSEGRDLESAVKSFEVKVAPTNYKRPTALVTPKMIEQAKKTVEELGLGSALERRYATLPDIKVTNVLWANRAAKKVMTGDVFDTLSAETSSKVKVMEKLEEVSIEKFITDILPKATSVEVLLENRHAPSFVSLITATDPTAGQLFKWDNPFSWSYAGEVADSIKERVKQAGGNVTGDLCCRLAWDNTDDLDLHMRGPGGEHLYFATRGRTSINGGQLDVDANGGDGIRANPVENIFYSKRSRMREGRYTLSVNQWAQRQTVNFGFQAEIDYMGSVYSFNHPKPMKTGENLLIATFDYTHTGGIKIVDSLPMISATKVIWGLPTQTFHQVTAVMHSPNFWDLHPSDQQVRSEAKVGNKHFFFMLDGAVNSDSARGFYNEFLAARLDPHRKVLEMIGSRLKPAPAADQLSGLGFSSTQRNTLCCRVKGSFTRTINIVF